MKLFVSVDMEGVAGVTHWEQVEPGSREYETGRRLMLGELNAALQGAFEGGAEAVVVNDSHADMRNLSPEGIWRPPGMEARVRLITGGLKDLSMMEGIQEGGYAGAIFLGYHGMAGKSGVLSHTYCSRTVCAVRLNGSLVGEATLNAALAGAYQVPVLFFSGEAAAVEEAWAILGGVPSVVTKAARSRYSAASLLPEDARALIRRGVKEAVERLREFREEERRRKVTPLPVKSGEARGGSNEEGEGERGSSGEEAEVSGSETEPEKEARPPFSPWLPPKPYILEVAFFHPGMADAASLLPDSYRRDPLTVAYRTEDYLKCFRAFRCLLYLARTGM